MAIPRYYKAAAPLRPVQLRVAFGVLRKRWRPFLKTIVRVTLKMLLGYLLLIVPGIIVLIRYSLYAPVVLIEGLEGKAAMRRARELASRSWRTGRTVSNELRVANGRLRGAAHYRVRSLFTNHQFHGTLLYVQIGYINRIE